MKICILGAGAYGLALTHLFYENKNDVTIWCHTKNEEKELKIERESSKLRGYRLPEKVKLTTSLKRAVNKSALIVIAVPAGSVSTVCKSISKLITKDQHILIASKGIEQGTCNLLNDVVESELNTNKLAVISGPTFAKDIVNDSQIGFSLATNNNRTKNLVKLLMESERTKLRETTDIIGVEICGSIKNVMAIASGILSGMKVSDSTKALFLTESLNDIKELIDKLDGNKNTILSFAGFGDILMTCTSENSRNFSYGKLIGEGKIKEALEYSTNTTVEGLYTLKSIKELIKREHVKMPIIDLISDIICGDKDKEELLEFLINKR